MSKQGILISVTDDQEGANPEIVTPDNRFPVDLGDTKVFFEKTQKQLSRETKIIESLDLILAELKIINFYNSIAHDQVIKAEDVK